jgi:hypothetical protein
VHPVPVFHNLKTNVTTVRTEANTINTEAAVVKFF